MQSSTLTPKTLRHTVAAPPRAQTRLLAFDVGGEPRLFELRAELVRIGRGHAADVCLDAGTPPRRRPAHRAHGGGLHRHVRERTEQPMNGLEQAEGQQCGGCEVEREQRADGGDGRVVVDRELLEVVEAHPEKRDRAEVPGPRRKPEHQPSSSIL
jgi:hypothetical protein